MDSDAIKVDLAAVAVRPTEKELLSWSSSQRVFVSSVMAGMSDARLAAAKVIERMGAEPVLFERFGGRGDDAENAYVTEVASCDIYIGLMGARYGKRLAPRPYSATHLEFLQAQEHGLKISVWVDTSAELDGPQHDFIEDIRGFFTTGSYGGLTELESGIADRLTQIAAEDLAPWCKLGPAMFRAQRLSDDGKKIRVAALIKDPDVRMAIERMRQRSWGQKTRTKFTWSGKCLVVSVDAVTVTITSTRTALLDIDLTVEAEQPGGTALTAGVLTVAVGTQYTGDDLAQLGLRASLFREPIPVFLKWAVKASDILAPLESISSNEDTASNIIGVLVAEHLVGHGQAKVVNRVRVGKRVDGARQLTVAWTGLDGKTRTVEGVAVC
jgi:hypothetical protein